MLAALLAFGLTGVDLLAVVLCSALPPATLHAAARRQGAAVRGAEDEPYADGDVWRLRNCPFDGVARTHPALVCGANRGRRDVAGRHPGQPVGVGVPGGIARVHLP
ncbi:hypothetical protein GCM10010399_79280 [Dactylosporangium fulvum]